MEWWVLSQRGRCQTLAAACEERDGWRTGDERRVVRCNCCCSLALRASYALLQLRRRWAWRAAKHCVRQHSNGEEEDGMGWDGMLV